ncbi:MAG: hypothetical protein QOI13_1063 [Paraburkholderia sp.]|jgi:hypothetical protein|nr:hypothetical protein [Paraburkholderia sp.]
MKQIPARAVMDRADLQFGLVHLEIPLDTRERLLFGYNLLCGQILGVAHERSCRHAAIKSLSHSPRCYNVDLFK